MFKQHIIAVFSGADGSLGYDNGVRYDLLTWMATPTNEVEPMGRQGIYVQGVDEGSMLVEYESIKTFTDNLSNVTSLENARKMSFIQKLGKSTKHTSACLHKAKDDEPIFVLRAKDTTAPRIVMEWASANINIQPQVKLEGALEIANEMMDWHHKNA